MLTTTETVTRERTQPRYGRPRDKDQYAAWQAAQAVSQSRYDWTYSDSPYGPQAPNRYRVAQ